MRGAIRDSRESVIDGTQIHPNGREVHAGSLRETSQADVPGFMKGLPKTSWDIGSVSGRGWGR